MLASLGDIFVNDAFSAAHRAHASTEGVAHLIPAYAGRAMEAELEGARSWRSKRRSARSSPSSAAPRSRPSSTCSAISSSMVDTLVIGGGMANTFLRRRAIAVGKSLARRDLLDTARAILAHRAKMPTAPCILPVDVVVAKEFKAGAETTTTASTPFAADDMILDVGPASIDRINAAIDDAATRWSGTARSAPSRSRPSITATVAAAKHAAARTKAGKLVSVAGGGDTVAALNHAGVAG